METFVFKPEFEKKLKKLGIKISNIKERVRGTGENWTGRCEELNKRNYWWGFVTGGFTWEDTPEGHWYWINIARK